MAKKETNPTGQTEESTNIEDFVDFEMDNNESEELKEDASNEEESKKEDTKNPVQKIKKQEKQEKQENNHPDDRPSREEFNELSTKLEKTLEALQLLKVEAKNKVSLDSESKKMDTGYGSVDDVLDNPVTFMAHRYRYGIFGSKKNGISKTNPGGGKILFTPLVRYTKGVFSDGTPKLVSLCAFVTHSKEVVDFLKNHEKFNVEFFAELGNEEKGSYEYQMFAAEAYNTVRDMSSAELINGLKHRRMNIPNNENDRRSALIHVIAREKAEVYDGLRQTFQSEAISGRIEKD